MRRRRWGAVIAAAVIATGCGGKNKPEPEEPEAGPRDPRAALLRLLEPELVRAPQTPAWVRDALFPGGYDQKQLVDLVDQSGGDLGVVPGAVVIMGLEQDVAVDRCDARCRRALLLAYLVVRRHDMLGRGLVIRGIASAEMWSGAGPDKGVEIAGYAEELVSKMAARSRAQVAYLIRGAPGATATIRSMLDLAHVEQSHGGYPLARALASGAVADPAAPAADLIEAAELCYRAAGLECGDRSLVRAREAPSRDGIAAERWTSVDRLKTEAHRAAALATRPSHRRELARLLVDLGREREAVELYTALLREHPKDAQMALGLARLQRTRTLSDDAARTILAAGPDNRDAAFYRVAAGVLAHHVFRLIGDGKHAEVEALAPTIRSILAEFAKHEPDRAEILQIGLDLILELIAGKADTPLGEWAQAAPLQRAIGRFVAARRRRPDSVPLARMVLFLSVLDQDAARKKTAVTAIGKRFAGNEELGDLLRDARILLGDEGIAAVVDRLGASSTKSLELKALWLDLTATQTDPGKKEEWMALASLYGELLQEMGDNPNPRTVNNYGTALHRVGAEEEARKVWAYAIQRGADHPAPGINLYATGEQDREQLWAWIQSKVSSDSGDTGRLARRWHIHVTATDDKDRAARLAALDAEPRINIGTGGIDSAVLAVKYELGVGYSTSEDLLLNIDLGLATWLVLKPKK